VIPERFSSTKPTQMAGTTERAAALKMRFAEAQERPQLPEP
jgi:hypothetical protein